MSPKTSPSNKWQPLPAAEFAKIMAQLEREDGTASNPIMAALPKWGDEAARRRALVATEMLAVADALMAKAKEMIATRRGSPRQIAAALNRASRKIKSANNGW